MQPLADVASHPTHCALVRSRPASHHSLCGAGRFVSPVDGVAGALLSFPTRRSSDLTEAIGVREAERLGIPIIGLVDTNVDPDPVSTRPMIGDRKSTRLNSSHRCISYAVFCLKKK